jgi:hypothetical protein
MLIPNLYGSFEQKEFFIYTAFDKAYFDDFGRPLINSVIRNSKVGIHVHLYNPTPDQIKFCKSNDRVSITHEHAPIELFEAAANKWLIPQTNPIDELYLKRILTSMEKGNDSTILERMQKTYFACARFIRLAQIRKKPIELLSIDSDAIVRQDINLLPGNVDFYIHQIKSKKDSRYLAGGIYLTPSQGSGKFLKEYAETLKNRINLDRLYWSMDQEVLNQIVPKYRYKELSVEYIDWKLEESSKIWTAKGKVKELEKFIAEKQKYIL